VGIKNTNRIVRRSGITYAIRRTRAAIRELFIRQQKNYLIRLGFIEEISRNKLRITDRGVELGAAINSSEMREAFSLSLQNMSWPHGNIYFYPFLLELLKRMPDKRLYQSEIDLFIIHTYNKVQFENRVEIIKMFRSLPIQRRKDLYSWTHNQLGTLLRTHRNDSAHGHYKGKVRELMIAFGCTSQLRYVDRNDPIQNYLAMRT
jgi:hypothetical protein